MKPMASHQYSVRGVPPEVDALLRKKAARTKRSLNQVIVEELTRATVGSPRKADFTDLVGCWKRDPGFDRTLASQRQIDWDKWK